MDCTFKTPEGKFNLRVGAVITDGKRVLVSKDGSHSFYWVTGGRVKLGETTEEAILREIREELGVEYNAAEQVVLGDVRQDEAEVARLYSIAEKFFTVDGVFYHELEYLYLIKPFDIAKIDYGAVHCDSPDISLVWLDTDSEPDMPVYPEHLFEAVRNPSGAVRIMVQKSPGDSK